MRDVTAVGLSHVLYPRKLRTMSDQKEGTKALDIDWGNVSSGCRHSWTEPSRM